MREQCQGSSASLTFALRVSLVGAKDLNTRDFLQATVGSEELRTMTPTTCTWYIVCAIIAHSQLDHLASSCDFSAMLTYRHCILKNVIWIVCLGVCSRPPGNHYHSSTAVTFRDLVAQEGLCLRSHLKRTSSAGILALFGGHLMTVQLSSQDGQALSSRAPISGPCDEGGS